MTRNVNFSSSELVLYIEFSKNLGIVLLGTESNGPVCCGPKQIQNITSFRNDWKYQKRRRSQEKKRTLNRRYSPGGSLSLSLSVSVLSRTWSWYKALLCSVSLLTLRTYLLWFAFYLSLETFQYNNNKVTFFPCNFQKNKKKTKLCNGYIFYKFLAYGLVLEPFHNHIPFFK